MQPHDLADKIEGLIIAANEQYAKSILAVEAKLYDDLVTVLRFVDLDSEGYIKQNAGNRQILRAAQKQFDTTINDSGYQTAVERHLSVIGKIDAINESYFQSVSSAFKPNRVFIKSLQTNAINAVNEFILQDGLQAYVGIPLREILSTNINSGGSYSGMLRQLQEFIKGSPKNESRLMSYSKTYLSDTLFDYSRAYQAAVTQDLGLVWFFYSGGVTTSGKGSKGSREFCLERVDKYFHKTEVEAWANLEWAGKKAGTTKSSIFIFAGGWNCKHSLIPVHESVVPQAAKDRISTN